jgi:GMP synthase (glutamine-hydrolysing)
MAPEGIILSGGPSSIYEPGSPKMDPAVFDLGIPVLGICYGLQFMVDALGGSVQKAGKREYGLATLTITDPEPLFRTLGPTTPCWMSHGDSIAQLPPGFAVTATTDNTPVAAAQDTARRLYGLQFHPEVVHTPQGKNILKAFLFDVCGCRRSWTMKSFAADAISEIRQTVGAKKVILGLSGGVDSSVAALLLHRAVGRQLTCIFVDNGLLRLNEAQKLKAIFKEHLQINIRFVSAGRKFLDALKGVSDPEKKTEDHRAGLHGGLRGRGAQDQGRRIFGPGHPLPRRDRIGVGLRRPLGGDQIPPQRRRTSQKDEAQAGGAAALSFQG